MPSETRFPEDLAEFEEIARQPDQTLIRVRQGSLDASAHVTVQVITADRPFIVETILQIANSLGFLNRGLSHPRPWVTRNEKGLITAFGKNAEKASRESWVRLDLLSPLGVPTDETLPGLERKLKLALDDLTIVSNDVEQMRENIRQVAESAQQETTRQMLIWLSDPSHFLPVGSQTYRITDTGAFWPRSNGLGILNDVVRATRRFHASLLPGEDPEELIVTKDSERSRIRRGGYLDYFGVRIFSQGKVIGEHRFLGLLTSTAYSESIFNVPLLAQKSNKMMEELKYDPESFAGRSLLAAMETFPREELLRATPKELYPILAQVGQPEERRELRMFLRRGRWGRMLTAVIYFPRDRYNTTVREKMIEVLKAATGAKEVEWSLLVSESVLARVYISLRVEEGRQLPHVDPTRLENSIKHATRSWSDRFAEIAERFPSSARGIDFSDAYKEAYTPLEAVTDLAEFNKIQNSDDLGLLIYQPIPPQNGVDFRLKIFRVGAEMKLSELVPELVGFGVDIVDEFPFKVKLRGKPAVVYDFGLSLPAGVSRIEEWPYDDRQKFMSALEASFRFENVTGGQ